MLLQITDPAIDDRAEHPGRLRARRHETAEEGVGGPGGGRGGDEEDGGGGEGVDLGKLASGGVGNQVKGWGGEGGGHSGLMVWWHRRDRSSSSGLCGRGRRSWGAGLCPGGAGSEGFCARLLVIVG